MLILLLDTIFDDKFLLSHKTIFFIIKSYSGEFNSKETIFLKA